MADEKPETAVNNQITDSVSQVNETVQGASQSQARAMADQVMAQAIGLAMQNAVAQQQQAYILRNAVTTAAARAILESSPEEALRFAREVLSNDDVSQTLDRLKKLMDDVYGSKAGGGE
jgi:hypothetical protein